MSNQNSSVYEFDSFRMDSMKRKLFCNEVDLQIKPKAFDILLFLAQRAGKIVSKEDLIGAVWSDTTVEENNLTQQISALRKKFGEYAGDDEFIITLPKQGYIFAKSVKEVSSYEENTFLEKVQPIPVNTATDSVANSLARQKRNPLKILVRFLFQTQLREITFGFLLAGFVMLFSFYVENHKFGAQNALASRSIVILDFQPLDTNEKSSLFSAGITRTLTAKIGNLESMVLRPAGFSGKFYGQERDVIAVGKEINADIVLEGSVQNDGNLARVVVVAWDMKARRKLWGEVFTKNNTSSFALQDEISEAVISAVQSKL